MIKELMTWHVAIIHTRYIVVASFVFIRKNNILMSNVTSSKYGAQFL